ncbi:histidine acid phosphatase [Aeromonas veronii]|uniref:histidine-type phosphatase n=1 Tax=Aeromonas veronii TaxID=654 RepID=UPI000C282E14|nr:histidine-type phosphatase [Aeromonas veronii]ATY82081.1 histidine acid phosphatase [Aeromonas veronii]
MTFPRASYVALAVSLVLLGGCQSENESSTDSQGKTAYQYSTKAVYSPQQQAESYEPAPQGFSPVFTEMVARHGSRSLSSPKYDVLTKLVWEEAQRQGALTTLGQGLGGKVDLVTAANQKLGYGLLSALGKEEHANLATRLAARLPTLLNSSEPHCIKVVTSGKDRANESAFYFMESLKRDVNYVSDSAQCYLTQDDPSKIDKKLVNKFELYFHKTTPEGDYARYLPAYESYQRFIGDEDAAIAPAPELARALDQLKNLNKTKEMARSMLERIYSKGFVDYLAGGVEFVAVNPEDGGMTYVRDEVDAALMLYNLFIIGPGMIREAQAQGSEPWALEQFLTPEESAWFSYLSDAEDFYEKGPSFANQSAPYAIAQPLLDGLFGEVQRQVVEGEQSRRATLRFAHAEAIIPLAALMKLEGSRQGASADQLFSQQNNEWRGGWVSPYTANIQWDIYQNGQRQVLVKMLYNEKEIAFKTGCQPYQSGSHYYDFEELKRCYGYNG